MKPKIQWAFPLFAVTLLSCSENKKTDKTTPTNKLSGTYKLLESKTIKGNDTTIAFTDTTKTEMFKMFNEDHFAFFNHDKTQGKDKDSLFVAGGGTYSLNGTQYVERLQYCTARSWENNDFKFELTQKGDTLIQKGEEAIKGLDIKQTILETYIKMKD